LFLLLLYLVDLQSSINMTVEIQPDTPTSIYSGLGTAYSWGLGIPASAGLLLIIPAVVILAAAVICLLRREVTGSTGLFLGCVIFLAPLLMALLRQPSPLHVRYFSIALSFIHLLFGLGLSSLYRSGSAGKLLSLSLLALYLAANGWQLAKLAEYGRGGYSAATRYIYDNTRSPQILVSGDHEFRIPVVLQFMAKGVKETGAKEIFWLKRDSWGKNDGPEWLITHRENLDDPSAPPQRLFDVTGNGYDLMRAFPTAPLSGLHWYLYRNLVK
jgi:hypothetical protein